jgi:hypothetical protein
VKPVPVIGTDEMVAFSPPVFCTVSVCDGVWPTWTLVNVRLAGDTVNVAGATPIPESAKSSAVLDPLTVIASVPLSAPAVVGVKTTAKVTL